jgi:1,4-dihydroxy-6-naphthoate synthase
VSFTLAYSPCPNDTYIFAALTNGLLEDAPDVAVRLADVEELNQAAARGEFELIKVSYGAIPHVSEHYRILRSGGAFARRRIAIPGERTTAFMLLQMALGRHLKTTQMRFDRIVAAVAEGRVDAGLIIHESRFTYRQAGLIAIADLGEWWENMALLPVPLGAIVVRNDVDDAAARSIAGAIRRSLAFARANDAVVMPYVRAHAFETSDEVARAHIGLYVNDFTDDLGDVGIEAVRALFARARDAGVVSRAVEPRFV